MKCESNAILNFNLSIHFFHLDIRKGQVKMETWNATCKIPGPCMFIISTCFCWRPRRRVWRRSRAGPRHPRRRWRPPSSSWPGRRPPAPPPPPPPASWPLSTGTLLTHLYYIVPPAHCAALITVECVPADWAELRHNTPAAVLHGRSSQETLQPLSSTSAPLMGTFRQPFFRESFKSGEENGQKLKTEVLG